MWSDSLTDTGYTRRLFFGALAATALIKLVAASLVPMIGDEAYFVLWGRHPDYGYYDHGGMVGWWLTSLLWVSDAPGWLRLPAVFVPLAVGCWLRQALQPHGAAKADLAAIIFLLSPVNLVNIFITTDTPLLAFTMLAGITALAADRQRSPSLWALAGFWLGLAFLSKYLAVLMGAAWAVWLLSSRPRPRWVPLALILLGAAPGVAVNVVWNHHHGWTNVLFNVMTRNGNAGFHPTSPPLYLLLWLVALGPALFPLVAAGLRRHGWSESWRRLGEASGRGPLLMVAVPAAILGIVSAFQNVGTHWLMAFIPWAALSIAAAAPADRVARMLKPAVFYAAVQAVVIAIAIVGPTGWLAGNRLHASTVIGVYPRDVSAALAPYLSDHVLASDSYSRAALLAYHLRQDVPVVGFGSHHGRQDDLLTDFRTLDGRNVMFFSNRPGRVERARAWFDILETRELYVRGARFTLVLGRGFHYDAYRETVLTTVAERYYNAPRWLTRYSPPADFVERYNLARDTP